MDTDKWPDGLKVDFAPDNKHPVTLRLDSDIISHFRSMAGERGYQSRINAVLRAFMNHQKEQGTKGNG